MSDQMPKQQREEYLTLIVGYLTEQYVHTNDPETKAAIEGYAQARRETPAIVSAAEAYFGSWGNALHTAGINPNLYFVHHTWPGRKR